MEAQYPWVSAYNIMERKEGATVSSFDRSANSLGDPRLRLQNIAGRLEAPARSSEPEPLTGGALAPATASVVRRVRKDVEGDRTRHEAYRLCFSGVCEDGEAARKLLLASGFTGVDAALSKISAILDKLCLTRFRAPGGFRRVGSKPATAAPRRSARSPRGAPQVGRLP